MIKLIALNYALGAILIALSLHFEFHLIGAFGACFIMIGFIWNNLMCLRLSNDAKELKRRTGGYYHTE